MARANRSAVLGLAVFAVGVVATLAILRARDSTAAPDDPGKVEVLYAEKPIPVGTLGVNAVNEGLVKSRKVSPQAKPSDALTEPAQLVGKTAQSAIPAGQVLTLAQFPQAQTRIGTVRIPENKTALALQMENVAGIAGFAGAGDKVNIYGVVKQGASSAAGARLLMQDIEVLSVNGTNLAPAQGQPGGAGLVFLLAVTPAQAERLVYLAAFEQLYFSLVPREHPPLPPSSGAGPGDALKPV